MNSYNLIGLMSGTSLDGLDIVFATYSRNAENDWSYAIKAATTIPYPSELFDDLKDVTKKSTVELLTLDKTVGSFYAKNINKFIIEHQLDSVTIDAIASHGHTVFHQPQHGFTYQIGCGETISYHTGIKVINDFRQKDVVAGGQGAPLVPIGDQLLFNSSAEAFLNIGGFANVSFMSNKKNTAYDICPANLPLNHFARLLGKPYDFEGKFARNGVIDTNLLEQLNSLSYYKTNAPKSLGIEWIHKKFMPLVNQSASAHNTLRTITEHIALQITIELHKFSLASVFITGGGAKNDFLIERIQHHFKGKVIIPSDEVVDFKEALIFGFLGALYLHGSANILSSVTGAERDTVGGVLHLPN